MKRLKSKHFAVPGQWWRYCGQRTWFNFPVPSSYPSCNQFYKINMYEKTEINM